jgi:ATP-dependent HslUV protease subunit HslV
MPYFAAAALALIDQPNMDAEQIVRKSMKIAGDICVYTNHQIIVESITNEKTKAVDSSTA